MPAARIQPQGRVRVATGNPLARGLVKLHSFARRDPTHTYQNNPALAATPSGAGPALNGSNQNIKLGFNVSGAEGTVLFFAHFPVAMSGCAVAQNNANDGYIGFGWQGGNVFVGQNSAGSLGSFTGLRVLATSWSTTQGGAAYLDGVRKFTIVAGAPGNNSAAYPLIVGSCSYSGAQNGYSFNQQTPLMLAYWNRALTDAEIAAVSTNPWQLFDGQPAMLSAASAPAGSGATASPPGVSASSAVGSATATGQAKASPAGVSTAASVGTATVSGQGKAAPVGVSAASAVGTATASGAASSTAQPVGVSAAASVGAAVATGQANAAPAGVSASAAVGTATATGQAITTAYPAGVQSAAAVGSATARGTATAAPLGVSSAIYVGTAYAYGPFDLASYPKLYATTLMRLDTVNRQGGALKDALAAQSAIRATQACSSLMREAPINLTSAMRSDPINRTAGLL